MADVKQFEIGGVYYPAKDVTARADIEKLKSDIAEVFSSSVSYSTGDYVIYEGVLYRFTSNHGAGAWNASHASAVSMGDDVKLKAPKASPAFTGTPTAPTASAGTNTTQIATTAFVKTADDNIVGQEILYFTSQAVNVVTNGQIMRIPGSGTLSTITTNTIVLDVKFAKPDNVKSNVSWQSYSGYITFTGTCTQATTAQVTLGRKGN